MIRQVESLPAGSAVEADACVVGAGLAGIEAARRLARRGLRVVLAESGRRELDARIQALTETIDVGKRLRRPDPDGPHNSYLPPHFRGVGRLRQLGGTSVIWTGKWREFDAQDFEQRPHVPHSGWPISLAELLPTYREIERDYGFGDFAAFAESGPYRGLVDTLAPHGLSPGFHYWEGQTTRPATRFAEELERSREIEVVLGATVTELRTDETGRRVVGARARSLEGHAVEIRADAYVVATGGLEAPRLLLASRGRHPNGIGNDADLVGRFFMDHPKVKGGRLVPGPAFARIPGRAAIFPRPRFQTSIGLSPDEQARHGLLSHALFLSPADPTPATQRLDAVRAAVRSRDAGAAARAASSVLASPASLAEGARRLAGRPRSAWFKAAFCAEQAPNPESRLLLSSERDALDMPRLVVDWRLTSLDERSFTESLARLTRALEASGIGALSFDPPATLDRASDANHPMGGTRMGRTPREGVVDRDCRVFGTDNLFVASASVFATGHSVAPTLTILACAVRATAAILADRESRPPEVLTGAR